MYWGKGTTDVPVLLLNQPILAGKRGSRRHSTTSISESVVVAETSYQMLEVSAFCYRERAQPSSITITVLTFLMKKSTIKNSGVSIF